MVRPLRVEFPGAVYHVFSRGNGKQKIFLDDDDYVRFLEILRETIARHNWVCHAYCLEVTHFHLLLETPDGNLSKGMHYLNGVYSQTFNRNHGSVGHVMQGRYHSPLVQEDSYFLGAARYIVLNPVYDKLVSCPAEWRWSSFNAAARKTAPPDFLEIGYTLGLFSSDTQKAVELYVQFIVEGKDAPRPPDYLGDVVVEGRVSDDQIKSALSPVRNEREYLRKDRHADRGLLPELFDGARSIRLRNEQIATAYLDHGYSRSEIAQYLEISISTVGRAIRNVRGSMD